MVANYFPRIKELREKNSYSVPYISKYLRINTSSYRNIEEGRGNLKIIHLIKLVELYKVSFEYILGLDHKN